MLLTRFRGIAFDPPFQRNSMNQAPSSLSETTVDMEKRKKLKLDIIEIRDIQTGKEPEKLKILTYKDLMTMTQNFSKKNFIGKFQLGRLYRGIIEQQHVTIKIWDRPDDNYRHFGTNDLNLMDELILLRHQKLQHPCIVSLYGYCRNKKHTAVVYNLNPMDSLHNLLLKDHFTWVQRIKVAFTLACFLKFFHAGLGDLDPFVIRNLSSAHVILDEEYNPKLVDFSMITGGIFPNKLVYTRQLSRGSFGYHDANYTGGSNPLDCFGCEGSMDPVKFCRHRLKSMTKNFSQENYIGSFQFGTLFRGFQKGFCGNIINTVVKIWEKKHLLDDNLLKLGDEMLLLHHEKYTWHPGLVRMFGYCIEDEIVAIVLFCNPKDSLHNLLHRDDFKWLYRIKAGLGVASLLMFLHGASYPMDPFVIGNLDASHIVLDEKYSPMLVDFGMISGGIFPNRTMDDNYGLLTTENDVFSFGRLLISLISKGCTKEAIMASNESRFLVHQTLQDEIMYYPEDGKEITRLARQCVHSDPTCRPTMSQVVEVFNKLKVVENHSDIMLCEKKLCNQCIYPRPQRPRHRQGYGFMRFY